MPITAARMIEGYQGESQDRVEILVRDEAVLVALADGAGGSAGGALAAEQLVRRALESPPGADPPAWCALLSDVDQDLAADPASGETTAIVAVLSPEGILGASVGDSEAWRVTPDGCEILTRHQRRKPLLGSGEALPCPFSCRESAGTLLVGSDGLFKYASAHRICEIVRSFDPVEAAPRLIDLVRMRSGGLQDDMAVAVCRAG